MRVTRSRLDRHHDHALVVVLCVDRHRQDAQAVPFHALRIHFGFRSAHEGVDGDVKACSHVDEHGEFGLRTPLLIGPEGGPGQTKSFSESLLCPATRFPQRLEVFGQFALHGAQDMSNARKLSKTSVPRKNSPLRRII